jgi:DNA-binding GntR family transcriptional regulator
MTIQSRQRLIKVQSIQEAVVENIRQRILNGELHPGQRLVQDELTAELGVSRTPIREALNQLAHEGLVSVSDHRRTFVAEFSIDDLIETYTMRAALESHAAYLAAKRITEPELRHLESILSTMGHAYQHNQLELLISTHHDFHAGINEAAQSPRLSKLILQYLELSRIYQRMAFETGGNAADPIRDHLEIWMTLNKHEAEAAARLTRAHLERTSAGLLEQLQEAQTSAQPDQIAE